MGSLILLNKKEKSKWFDERLDKGYSFCYFKGFVPRVGIINIGVRCFETQEEFYFHWGQSL